MASTVRPSCPVPSSLLISCRYVNTDRAITKRFVQHAERRGVKALFITVDAPQLGRREKVRLPFYFDAVLRDLVCVGYASEIRGGGSC